jgi:hypothetical protein
MRGAMPPLPYTSSWRGARLSTGVILTMQTCRLHLLVMYLCTDGRTDGRTRAACTVIMANVTWFSWRVYQLRSYTNNNENFAALGQGEVCTNKSPV